MQSRTDNKIILVTRPTRLAELVARFNTVGQARFYVEHLGADFSDYQREDHTYRKALANAQTTLAEIGRLQVIDRKFLPNFVFGEEDTIVVLGQDGLVANTLKYLDGQPVIGVNPDPSRWDGRLLPFQVRDLRTLTPEVFAGRRPVRSVTMAKAALNDGQSLYAVNDLYVGQRTHASSRYVIRSGETSETHSSSGVIISTGMGSTGWLKSLLTGAEAVSRAAEFISLRGGGSRRQEARASKPAKPVNEPPHAGCYGRVVKDFGWNSDYLFFTVREPFPMRNTGTSLVFGKVTREAPLIVESQMAENGVIFSDGIEQDFLEFNSGSRATIGVGEKTGTLVV